MGSAATVAAACAEVNDGVFELRQAISLTWQGNAAQEFAEKVEECASRAGSVATDLAAAVRLIQVHEHHMRLVRIAMSGG